MTNEQELADIRQWIQTTETHSGVRFQVERLLQMISEYEARIAAYELEIKELKAMPPLSGFAHHQLIQMDKMVNHPVDGPPLGSTLLSESQYTLAAKIERGEV